MGKKEAAAEMITRVVKDKDLDNIYFNGFTSTISNGDILLILQRNGEPVAAVNASYTVAKTLVQKLGDLIANLEAATGNKIMTTDVIDKTMLKKDEE